MSGFAPRDDGNVRDVRRRGPDNEIEQQPLLSRFRSRMRGNGEPGSQLQWTTMCCVCLGFFAFVIVFLALEYGLPFWFGHKWIYDAWYWLCLLVPFNIISIFLILKLTVYIGLTLPNRPMWPSLVIVFFVTAINIAGIALGIEGGLTAKESARILNGLDATNLCPNEKIPPSVTTVEWTPGSRLFTGFYGSHTWKGKGFVDNTKMYCMSVAPVIPPANPGPLTGSCIVPRGAIAVRFWALTSRSSNAHANKTKLCEHPQMKLGAIVEDDKHLKTLDIIDTGELNYVDLKAVADDAKKNFLAQSTAKGSHGAHQFYDAKKSSFVVMTNKPRTAAENTDDFYRYFMWVPLALFCIIVFPIAVAAMFYLCWQLCEASRALVPSPTRSIAAPGSASFEGTDYRP